ncbi:hypothetical protein [Serinicoccus chungangensis]|uniref:hypothetical protein n=1 Tax=Serinicoccus chungangensis TaxID=767452 RepID=UPI0011194B20|nr:hypothetical protein [Serinicoccus chungangensis]
MSPAQSLHLLAAAEEGGHHVVNELPFPPIMFGVIAMLSFLLLLGFLWFFRNTLALDPHGVADAHHNPDMGRDQH